MHEVSEWAEKSKALMAWAVTVETRRATYIGSLRLEKNGLKCGCVCPACGGVLQAVNAGKPASHFTDPNTLRPHFRHDAGQQKGNCLLKIAQIAALQLLIEQKEIDLPAPKASRSVIGASGKTYSHEVFGEQKRYRIVSRKWLDEHRAQITLNDGRVVMFRLAGESISSNDGTWEAIITIKIDDPEVSTWSPEKILASAELAGEWLCWDRHWQDKELVDMAAAGAAAKAKNNLDLVTDEMVLPEGLSSLQRSESVLHWLIKDILTGAGNIKTPPYVEVVSKEMPDDSTRQITIQLPAKTLALSEVRIEFGLEGMVPDVMCKARDVHGKLGTFDLMIEVAVTHRVDKRKRERIRSRGLACLEVDVNLFTRSGRTPLEALRAMICGDPSSKRWINHGEIQRLRNVANSELEKIASQIKLNLQSEAKKRSWFSGFDERDALDEYLHLVKQKWAGETRNSISRDGIDCTAEDMALFLASKSFVSLNEPIFSDRGGILWGLETLRQSCIDRRSADVAFQVFSAVLSRSDESRRFISLLLIGIKVYKAEMWEADLVEFGELKAAVLFSIKAGELKYARPKTYDAAITHLFPEMKAKIENPFGTIAYAHEVVREKQAAQRKIDALKEKEIALERTRTAETAKKAQDAEALRTAISRFNESVKWFSKDGWPNTVDQSKKQLQPIDTKNVLIKGMTPANIVESAWSARDRNLTIGQWLFGLQLNSKSEVSVIGKILKAAWLVP